LYHARYIKVKFEKILKKRFSVNHLKKEIKVGILYPMFGMIALTGVIMLALFFSRLPTIVQNFGNLQAAKHSDELRPRLPDTKRYITDNHNHLFEQPTVFYAIVVYIYLVQHVDSLHIMLAWAYVIFRAIHSIIHVTINNVSIRASVFVFSLICLVWMTIREGLFFLAI